jgi:hypothetical protein
MDAIWRGARREDGVARDSTGGVQNERKRRTAIHACRVRKRRLIDHQPRCAPGSRRARKTLLYNADDIARFLFT